VSTKNIHMHKCWEGMSCSRDQRGLLMWQA
jgi:hypothetical protein